MTFCLKLNKLFYSMLWRQLLVPAIFGLGFYVRIARRDLVDLVDYILLSCFVLLLVTGIVRLGTLLYRIARKKPALTVNEVYVYDHYKGVKYLWKDVKDAVESKDVLNVHLYDPVGYIDQIESPLRRFFIKLLYKLFRKKPSYKIDLSHFLDTNNSSILIILNDYSIKASA